MTLTGRMKPLLGTYVEVSIEHHDVSAELLESYFAIAFNKLAQVQTLLSVHDNSSELSRLNLALHSWLALSTISLRVLRLAHAMMKHSNGLFNPTMGYPLVQQGILPDLGYGDRLATGNLAALSFRPGQVKLNQAVVLCLDGIAKGYAVDLALAALKRAGVNHAFINAGGDIRAMGNCQVPIRLRYANQPLGLLHNAAIASSGARQQTHFRGRLMTASGAILPSGEQDYSVIAHRAWRADALTKVLAQQPTQVSLLNRLGGNVIMAKGA